MTQLLTKTQLAHVLAGIAGTEHKTALRYLDGEAVRQTVRERLDLARRQWDDMVATYQASQAARAQPGGPEHAAR
ncbi:hypothetical protein [Polyangium jinanense]|uniref:Uncharacterized protein n=1 Tax=Polyangium jinanense TaxID=2829994 RepID=A0A9X4AY19_9BACT|nr:hypothetical protein [Polyangium jinanense]MDC3962751.1 hypothetical protein [Polyangium jinanense]MDC3989258.1 hypothetical protein [Polyangium jinanense]